MARTDSAHFELTDSTCRVNTQLEMVHGVLIKQLGTLTFLVQLDNGMFWKRHVDQLCQLHLLEDLPRDVTIPESTTQ